MTASLAEFCCPFHCIDYQTGRQTGRQADRQIDPCIITNISCWKRKASKGGSGLGAVGPSQNVKTSAYSIHLPSSREDAFANKQGAYIHLSTSSTLPLGIKM